MGCSWALYVCQSVCRDIVATAVPGTEFLGNHEPSPNLERGCCTVYVGNFAELSTDPETCRSLGEAVLAGTHRRGLRTHELPHDTGECTLLGLRFVDCHRTCPGRGSQVEDCT